MLEMDDAEETYANVREFIGHLIGKRIIDITQQDKDEWEESGQAYIMFMFDDGNYFKVFIGDEGIDYSSDDEEGAHAQET